MKGIIERIDQNPMKINPRYTMRWNDTMEILQSEVGQLERIAITFRFGYMQGMKAAKSEMKKAGAAK